MSRIKNIETLDTEDVRFEENVIAVKRLLFLLLLKEDLKVSKNELQKTLTETETEIKLLMNSISNLSENYLYEIMKEIDVIHTEIEATAFVNYILNFEK